MAELFRSIKRVQSNNDENSFMDILDKFYPKINKFLSQTHSQQRDDLKQELIITIYNKAKTYPLDKVPGFDEFEKKKIK